MKDAPKVVKRTRESLASAAARLLDKIAGFRRSPSGSGSSGSEADDGLREIVQVRQISGEAPRRWFTSSAFDLFVWCDDSGNVNAFQFYYDKPRSEHALVWKRGVPSSHFAVDDGEGRPFRHKGSPILVADGHFDVTRVADRLASAGGQVPQGILDFVLARVREYPQSLAAGP
jgi:hypothetical protein